MLPCRATNLAWPSVKLALARALLWCAVVTSVLVGPALAWGVDGMALPPFVPLALELVELPLPLLKSNSFLELLLKLEGIGHDIWQNGRCLQCCICVPLVPSVGNTAQSFT